MVRLRWKIISVIFIISTVVSGESNETVFDKKLIKNFEINWESMDYDKRVSRYNLNVSSNQQRARADENLTLRCTVEIKDPNLVFGISRKGILTEMTGGKKQKIEIDQEQSMSQQHPMRRSMEMAYEGLRYHRRYTQPPQVPKWQAWIYKYLKIPQKPFRPQLVDELQPPRIRFELDLALLDQSGGKIRSLKGHYYVLMAESIDHIEVPFEPNDTWVRLTDDLEIQVLEAECKVSGSGVKYSYEIEENRSGTRRMHRISAADYLPQKMVMGRQFIGRDGKQRHRSLGIMRIPAHVGGRGSGSSSSPTGISPIEKIRFLIAVDPKHCKIPFELKNIPLPDPESEAEN